ncbi:MAG TPA: ABC transporter substrate-binding protein [Verrucomicrobiae bacterium]|jgi:putative ABC transport system substrate-binding protein|nr:ABC transporter substrate-binding protein [Verrucomicrobiae bacterium]
MIDFYFSSYCRFMWAGKAITIATAVASIFFSSPSAQAQPASKIPTVGFIQSSRAPGDRSIQYNAFTAGLRDLGYVEGKDIHIESRFAEGRLDRMPALVKDLIARKVDVILAPNNVVIQAAKEATKTIPIVMVTTVDPVSAGYVKNFARPGENITGLANLSRDLSAKRVELLKEVLPKLSRIAVLWDGDGPGPAIAMKEYREAARAFKLDIRSLDVHGPRPDFGTVLESTRTARAEALIVVGNALMNQHAKEIFELAINNRLPSMTEEARYVNAGGLISYGANISDLYRRAAGYVVDILKGAKPGDLPVRLPEKFEIGVNLKTARQLDIILPQRVLIQADVVVK